MCENLCTSPDSVFLFARTVTFKVYDVDSDGFISNADLVSFISGVLLASVSQ